jgi:muramoyltetrapeptide carboxypeptidase
MMKSYLNIVAVSVCLFCFGCAKIGKEHAMEDATTVNGGIFPAKWLKIKDVDEICRRMSRLNMTVVAPSSGLVTASQVELMTALCEKYDIDIPLTTRGNRNEYHCSDTEENRLKYFREAINSKHEILWAIRGGVGAQFLIVELDKRPVPAVKKTLIGFSDTTALHLFVTQKWGWRSLHAPVFTHLQKGDFSKAKFDTVLDILENRIKNYVIDNVHPINATAQRMKRIVGKLSGGNLTLVECSIGTCWEIQLKDKILFLEDINLSSWRIYRSLYHLKESGVLKGVKAIVFGLFSNGGDQKEIRKYLSKFADSISIPAYVTNMFGHGNYNKPLIYDAVAVLKGDKMIVTVK